MTPLRLHCPAMRLLVRCMQLFLPSVSTVFAQLITNNLTVFLMRCILLWKCFLSTHVHYFVGTSLIVATSFVYTWHRLDHLASIPTPMNPTTGFTLCFVKQQSGALTICLENPKIPGRIQIERFIPVEIFRKKVIPFEVLPFSRSYRNDQNFLYHLFGLPVPGFMSREGEKFTGILLMVQLNPVPVFGAQKKHQYHLTEIFHRNCRTNGKCSWFLSFPKVIRPTALGHCVMTRSSYWDEVFKGIGRSLFFLLFENDSRAL